MNTLVFDRYLRKCIFFKFLVFNIVIMVIILKQIFLDKPKEE